MDKLKDSSKEFIDIMPTIQKMLKEKNSNTAEKALVWMRHLLQTYSDKLLPTIDDILEYVYTYTNRLLIDLRMQIVQLCRMQWMYQLVNHMNSILI